LDFMRCEPARRQGASDSGGSIEDDRGQNAGMLTRLLFLAAIRSSLGHAITRTSDWPAIQLVH
jgi:hypothetical protein